MNNDNDLNLHSVTKLSGWLRHCFMFLFQLHKIVTCITEPHIFSKIPFEIVANIHEISMVKF